MAVNDMWWTVFWPWALVWALTVAAVLGGLGILVALALRWRRTRGRTRHPTPGISVYMDKAEVIGLYLRDTYRPAMSREIEEQITSTTSAKLAAELYGLGAEAGREVNQQVATKYVDQANPVAVIRIVIDVLEEKGDIIYVDLLDGVVEPDRSLHKKLPSRRGVSLPFTDLARPDAYISVWGSFDLLERTDDNRAVFASSAPGGDEAARVVFRCPIDQISTEDMLAGPFMARCLGRIRRWDPDSRKLSIRPIAVFN